MQRMYEEKRLQMERGSISGSYFMVQLPDGTMEKRLKMPINADPGVHSSLNLELLAGQQGGLHPVATLPTITESKATDQQSPPDENGGIEMKRRPPRSHRTSESDSVVQDIDGSKIIPRNASQPAFSAHSQNIPKNGSVPTFDRMRKGSASEKFKPSLSAIRAGSRNEVRKGSAGEVCIVNNITRSRSFHSLNTLRSEENILEVSRKFKFTLSLMINIRLARQQYLRIDWSWDYVYSLLKCLFFLG